MIGTLLRFNENQNEHNRHYTGLMIVVENIMPEDEKIFVRYHMINDGDFFHLKCTSSINSYYIKRFDFI